MVNEKIIDNLSEKQEFVLFSRLSILFISMLTTPLFGGILYCSNLKRTKQVNKIFGTYIAIALSSFLVIIPFFGFNIETSSFTLLSYLNNIVVSMLMIFPFWSIHFSRFKYESIFPWGRIITMILIYACFVGYTIWLNTNYSYFNQPPKFLPRFSFMMLFPLISVAVFVKFIYNILSSKKDKAS